MFSQSAGETRLQDSSGPFRPNQPVERTAHSLGFFANSQLCCLWAAAHRERSASPGFRIEGGYRPVYFSPLHVFQAMLQPGLRQQAAHQVRQSRSPI